MLIANNTHSNIFLNNRGFNVKLYIKAKLQSLRMLIKDRTDLHDKGEKGIGEKYAVRMENEAMFYCIVDEILGTYYQWIDMLKYHFSVEKFIAFCDACAPENWDIPFRRIHKLYEKIKDSLPRVYAVILNKDLDKVLLVRNNAPVSIWSLPGGRMEPGETYEQTIQREMQEELGMVPELEELGSWREVYQYRKKSRYYILNIEEIQCKPPNPYEIREIKWVSLFSLPNLTKSAQKALDLALEDD